MKKSKLLVLSSLLLLMLGATGCSTNKDSKSKSESTEQTNTSSSPYADLKKQSSKIKLTDYSYIENSNTSDSKSDGTTLGQFLKKYPDASKLDEQTYAVAPFVNHLNYQLVVIAASDKKSSPLVVKTIEVKDKSKSKITESDIDAQRTKSYKSADLLKKYPKPDVYQDASIMGKSFRTIAYKVNNGYYKVTYEFDGSLSPSMKLSFKDLQKMLNSKTYINVMKNQTSVIPTSSNDSKANDQQ